MKFPQSRAIAIVSFLTSGILVIFSIAQAPGFSSSIIEEKITQLKENRSELQKHADLQDIHENFDEPISSMEKALIEFKSAEYRSGTLMKIAAAVFFAGIVFSACSIYSNRKEMPNLAS